MAVVVAASQIDRARFIGHFIVSHVLVSVVRVATVTAEIFSLTRDDLLRRNVDVGPGSISSNFDSI